MTKEIKFKKSPNIKNLDTIMFLIVSIDILFLPYIRFLSVSISMIILPVWLVFNLKKIRIERETRLILVFFLFSLLSFLISIIKYPEWLIKNNLITLGIILFGFVYYLFFKYYFENYQVKLSKYLYSYIIFVFTLAFIYIIDASTYFKIRSFWTLSGNVIELESSLLIHRFTSTFSDPNNAATAILGIFVFLMFNNKLGIISRIVLATLTFVIIISTMSSTGIIMLLILFILIAISFLLSLLRSRGRIQRSGLYSLSISMMLLPFIILVFLIFMDSEVAKVSFERFSMNSPDSRISIWERLLSKENIFNYLLIGMGGTILIDEIPFRPHNGHLHLIYNYGFVSYIIFLYVFFRPRMELAFRRYLFLLPFIIGFTMNVGIYEPRFTNILAMLVAYYAAETFRKSNNFN